MAPISRSTTGLLSLILLCPGVLSSGPAITPYARVARQAATPTTTSSAITAVSDCHLHGATIWCMAGADEFPLKTTVTATEELPASFTGCHNHGSALYCIAPNGDDVEIDIPSAAGDGDTDGDHADDESGESESENPSGLNCHFHAGVEHCVGAGESESGGSTTEKKCDKVDREYNVRLRIGLIFAILATSAVGVFAPIFLAKWLPSKLNVIWVTLKQFGTGIIISTAFVHLFVHAMLMFQNDCVEGIEYEGTAASIFMAGIFISFLVEYFGERFMRSRLNKKMLNGSPEGYSVEKANASLETVNIYVMEAGIIFHSLIIGVTLVVSGDSFFITLFIVIVFHQFFEGLALGSRIASLGTNQHHALAALGHHSVHQHGPGHHQHHIHPQEHTSESLAKTAGGEATSLNGSNQEEEKANFPMWHKMVLAACFALVTPIGMAIGTGCLSVFNGNDPATAIAIGTLDAFSGGILVWVGLVEMWAGDWMGGEMANASAFSTFMGIFGLMAGMALMSFLGKWA
ncbi:hypothetical protein SAPIO_CDS3846 [Scedosporium apiospermum]|uniref:Uncharacterized protein n=1 Tax=Pseudallescheria apiosperma TaxID=563466 RepID=A0A084G9S7_PSEDA|nr:uncharacterized protein SAPIO_CDS3846 [Scedosporium apiospermum]KEZ44089.1 hypothetical protein SAPIO_CDS3846 [Scedosporium apiospermum]